MENKNISNEDISTDVFTKAGTIHAVKVDKVDKVDIYDEDGNKPNPELRSENTKSLENQEEKSGTKTLSQQNEANKCSGGSCKVPMSEIIVGNIIILVCITIYSMFPRIFLNLDISFLCIILMVGLNFYQRSKYGENPSLNDYRFVPAYITGGVYALIPSDLMTDIVPVIGSIDDVIIVWTIILVCFIAERNRS